MNENPLLPAQKIQGKKEPFDDLSETDTKRSKEIRNQMASNNMIRISPTTGLNLFRQCPQCFWIHYNKKVQRPRGIFPSLPGGMDLVIKKYFDQYRGDLPPEIVGKVEGRLMPDLTLMEKWRNWRTGLEYHDKESGAVLFGALDDCLLDRDRYIPLDYKTKGSAPHDGDSEKYYQTQLDTYCFLLEENGYKTADCAYLVYYYPEEVTKNGVVHFKVEPIKISTDHARLKKLFEDAVQFLKGPMPEEHGECEYCVWVNDRYACD